MKGLKGRKERRVLLQKEVLINDIIKGYILDLSVGGMYIYTQAEFIRGATLELSFSIKEKHIKTLPSLPVPPDAIIGIKEKHIKTTAIVQYKIPGVGIGIKFLNLSLDNFSCIKRFLECQPDIITEENAGGKKILLVDDNPQSRGTYRNRLLGEGLHVIEASNGLEAVKRLWEINFDLVVLDLCMEGIDGFKILQIMKVNPELKEIPVIILSTKSTSSDLEKAMLLGAKDYLVKMTTPPLKLAEKIKKILEC